MIPQQGNGPYYGPPQGFATPQGFIPRQNPQPAPQRFVLGGGDSPAFQQPGMPTQPGANYNVPPAMVMATMAAHLPASQPVRVPLGVSQGLVQINGSQFGAPLKRPQPGAPLNLGPTPLAQANHSARSPIYLPGPESFGLVVSTQQTQEVDWLGVRNRIKALGIRSFQHEEFQPGRHRFTCQLNTNQGALLLVEGSGTTESEAIEGCLAKAVQVRQGR